MNYDENEGKEPLTTPDTENSTRINANEGTESSNDKTKKVNGRRKWERLSGVNTGAVDSFGMANDEQVSKQDRASAFDIISKKANLPKYLRREGRNLMMEQIDMAKLKRPGSSIHLVAFCLAVVLVNERCDRRNYHPQGKDNDVYLVEMREEFGFDIGLIHSYLQKLPNEVEL